MVSADQDSSAHPSPAPAPAAPFGDPALAAPTGSVLGQWADWLRLIYLRRWLVVSLLAAGVFAALWSSAVAQRGYDATVTLYIAPVPPNVVQYQEVVDPQTRPYREEFWYGTQYALLRSQPLLRRVADRLSLWDRAELLGPVRGAAAEASETSWVVRAIAAAREWIARWRPADPPGAAAPDAPLIDPALPPLTPAEAAVIGRMLVGTSVTPLPETRLVSVRLRLGSAQLAHDVALALAEEYIAYDIDHRTTAAREAVDWIAGQIEQQRAEVAAAETAVVAYRTAHPDVPLGDDTMVAEQGLVELQEDLNDATTVRIARRAAYRQVTDAAGDPARLVRLPALTAEPVLQNAVGEVERLRADEQRLAETFGDLHPDLVRARADVRAAEVRLGERIADLVAGLQLSVEVAEEQERALRGMLRQRLAARVRAGRVTVEHASLVRAAEAAHAILRSLSRRLHETQVMAELRTTAARIAEPPLLPQAPSVPRTLLRLRWFALVSLLGAFGLSAPPTTCARSSTSRRSRCFPADGAHGRHVRAAAAVDHHLAAVGIAQGPQRVDAEVHVAAVAALEQGTVGFLRRRRRVVEGAEVPQHAATGAVLGDDLLEGAKVVVHAGNATRTLHLPGETDDVAGSKERLDQPERLGLEAVLLRRVQQTRRQRARRGRRNSHVVPRLAEPDAGTGHDEPTWKTAITVRRRKQTTRTRHAGAERWTENP